MGVSRTTDVPRPGYANWTNSTVTEAQRLVGPVLPYTEMTEPVPPTTAEPSPFRAVGDLTTHTFAAATAFVVILVFAIALDQLAKLSLRAGLVETDSGLYWLLIGGKYLLLLSDAILFVVFLWKAGKRAIKKF